MHADGRRFGNRFLASCAVAASLWAAEPPKTIVIENVFVVDVAKGVVRPRGHVKIAAAESRVVDARGGFLIPGMWDMHVEGRTETRLAAMVAEGIAGVRDFGTPWKRIREWQGRGGLPAVVGSGEALEAHTAIEARAAFDRAWKLDVNFVSVRRDLPGEAYIALAEQARHWRVRLAGPVPSSIAARDAAEARQWSIEGTAALDAAALERCALMGTRLTPLLASASVEDRAEAVRVVAAARRAGVEILAGSGVASIQAELEQLVAAGMSAREALAAATVAPRKLLGVEDSDVVLLRGNPLQDVRNTRRVAGVVLRGRYRSVGN